MKLRVRESEAGPIPSETMRTRFFLGGVSTVVSRVSATTRISVQTRVRKNGTMERRKVRRHNQWRRVSEDDVEDVSERSSSSPSSRDVEEGIRGGCV